jgi:hypothetical protein
MFFGFHFEDLVIIIIGTRTVQFFAPDMRCKTHCAQDKLKRQGLKLYNATPHFFDTMQKKTLHSTEGKPIINPFGTGYQLMVTGGYFLYPGTIHRQAPVPHSLSTIHPPPAAERHAWSTSGVKIRVVWKSCVVYAAHVGKQINVRNICN